MSYDAVEVRKGVWWGYLPPYLPEPERCRFDKSTYHFCQLELAFWEVNFPFSELGFRFSFRAAAVQLLDRFTTASRVRAALFVRSLFDYIECLPTA